MTDINETLQQRGTRYGEFIDNAATAQTMKALLRDRPTWTALADDQRQALDVICDKISRIMSGDPNYADNWHDIAGYATLVEKRLAAPIAPSGVAPDPEFVPDLDLDHLSNLCAIAQSFTINYADSAPLEQPKPDFLTLWSAWAADKLEGMNGFVVSRHTLGELDFVEYIRKEDGSICEWVTREEAEFAAALHNRQPVTKPFEQPALAQDDDPAWWPWQPVWSLALERYLVQRCDAQGNYQTYDHNGTRVLYITRDSAQQRADKLNRQNKP